ncbi:MAG TPA: DUF115 domain-containing protein, partial [Spirochaetota bacterium]|nr:DUF115 domain-containing protein [Spirochaetota bacterium]
MNYIRETGKKGFLTYKFNDKYIYSSYDPFIEAKRFVSTLKINSKTVITCCGPDYVNSNLLDLGITEILSFEPISFEHIDNSDCIKRFTNTAEIEDYIKKNKITNPQLIIWQPLIETNPDFFLFQLRKIKDFIQKETFSNNATNYFGFIESKNIIRNICRLDEIDIIKKSDVKIDLPALVISSGFSLKDNIDFIKKIIHKVYVFALPSALPYLEYNNIEPDFVIAVDPGYGTFYHLAKYKKTIKLITTLSINPTVFNLNNYKPFFFNYDNQLENIFYKDTNIIKSFPEGSVIFNTLRIVKLLGFNDIIIIGQDFGFKDGRSHIYDGLFEKEFLNKVDYFLTLESQIKEIE